MNFLPLVNKARKPKFELHLTIYDLNNVPLIAGVSFIKWHLPHSISSEHRGRTPKCPIADHRVEYNYGKVIPVRIGIDKNNNLVECPIEFEILQEFSATGPLSSAGAAAVVGGGATEKINLGVVRINLSEYVEESEALLRTSRRISYSGSELGRPLTAGSATAAAAIPTSGPGHSRKRSSFSTAGSESLLAKSVSSYQSSNTAAGDDSLLRPTSHATNTATGTIPDVDEGVIRRYLMQDSKINSTLKVGILMVQVDGERNYVAPPLKTAPVFGGIAGLMASGETAGSLEPPADIIPLGHGSAAGGDAASAEMKLGGAGAGRDLYEVQDMYRRALAASWACQPSEMPADELIEDIFSGGDGFRDDFGAGRKKNPGADATPRAKNAKAGDNSPGQAGKSPSSSGGSGDGEDDLTGGASRPHHLARLKHHFHRNNSGNTNSSGNTSTAFPAIKDPQSGSPQEQDWQNLGRERPGNGGQHGLLRGGHRREDSREEREGPRSRGESMRSLATTMGSSEGEGRGREGFKKPREVREADVREDMVAWTLGGVAT